MHIETDTRKDKPWEKIIKVAGWTVIVLLQIIAAGGIALSLSGLWPIEEVTTMDKFSLIIGTIFEGFIAGVYGVGMLSLVLHRSKTIKAGLRLLFTAGCASIPFLSLFIIGWYVKPCDQPIFQRWVMEFYQPLPVQSGLALAVLGFWIPDWIRKKIRPV